MSDRDRLGEELGGKYKVSRRIGEGGMGAVYEAQHTLINRRFAIKFLHTELANNPEILTRFRREASTAGSLEQENVAAITDFGTADDGAPYMVMEFLEGEDLAGLLARSGPLPVPRAVYAVIQACRGLEAAHAKGITHRDLKPENLFVTRRADGADLVKVLDFGIAKLKDSSAGSMTRTGTTMGTPFYMPPEQARGQKDLDERADIYALGVILYELLSGAKPHPGESYNEILCHIITQPAAPIASLRDNLPAGLPDVIHRAMAPAPADRFRTVADLAAALAPFAGRAMLARASEAPAKKVQMTTLEAPDAPVQSQREASILGLARTQVLGGSDAVQPPIPMHDDDAQLPINPRSKTPFVLGFVGVACLSIVFAWLALRRPQVVPQVSARPEDVVLAPSAVEGVASTGMSPSTVSASASADTRERPPGQIADTGNARTVPTDVRSSPPPRPPHAPSGRSAAGQLSGSASTSSTRPAGSASTGKGSLYLP